MGKTLGGVMFIKDGVKYDYCFQESIRCLCDMCDQVSVVGIESEDNTIELLYDLGKEYNNLFVTVLSVEEWNKQKGREKLAFFQNLALSFLDTDYYYLQQADEITHEAGFEIIREAIAEGEEAYYIRRVNMWGDCNHCLIVPEERQPCSTKVIRLAKTKYISIGDGESIDAPAVDKYLSGIYMRHYGFVRKREVMKDKVINMQENVFELGFHDPKLDQSEIFKSELWFSGKDLNPTFFHSKYIQKWVLDRP